MSLLDDLKAKADANGDGKISLEDLEALRDGSNNSAIDKIKEVAQNTGGKIDFEEIKNLNIGGVIDYLKKKFSRST